MAQGPVLRASVDQVVVDVVVTDAAGAPVTGLTAADFEILERGKPQTISSFTEVSLPLAVRPEGAVVPVPSDVRSNHATGERRYYVLVFDGGNLPVGLTGDVQALARAFVRRVVQSGDLVAVVSSGGLNAGMLEFTEDMARVEAAIGRFAGGGVPPLPHLSAAVRNKDRMSDAEDGSDDAADRLARGSTAFETLAALTDSLAGVSGRKSVLLISTGVPIDPGSWTTSQHENLLRDVIAGAARANVTIYTFDPTGLDHEADMIGSGGHQPQDLQRALPGADRRARGRMLEALASMTGGRASIDANNPVPVLVAAARDNSQYYLLGFASTDTKRDGRYRRIEVRVRRPGLQVRARQGYFAPKDRRRTRTENARPVPAATAALDALVARPVGTPGLPITAQAIALPAAQANVRVLVEVGAEAGLRIGDGGGDSGLDFQVLPVLPGGHTLPSLDGHIALGDAAIGDVHEHGVRLVERLTLPPGSYQLRVAVRERAGGRAGSVYCDLTVPDPKKDRLVMSGLVVSASGAGQVPSASIDSGLSTMLEGPPTTSRTFAPDQTLRAYTELKAAGNAPVDITTVVRDASGREVLRRPEPAVHARVTESNSLGYAIDLPLAPFAPGEYVLRVEARSTPDRPALSRDVAFTVRR
jgi:VWFA-related protein